MADYGVLPAGFVRKPLPQILAEFEEKARQVFGPGMIQTTESPMGQLNGLAASIVDSAWQIAESTYQSYDPDQAEGVRLEQLGRVRLLERVTGESDVDYRQAITNAGTARIDLADIARAALNVDGVTYARVFLNSTSDDDAHGLPAHSITVAALGGNDDDIGRAIRPYVVPGIDTAGNVRVNVTIDGYCRSITFARPVGVPLGLQLVARVNPDRGGCPPPSNAAIALAVSTGLTGANRPANGEPVTLHMIRTAVTSAFPNVEILSGTGNRLPDGPLIQLPFPIAFLEIAAVDPAHVTVQTT